MAPLFYEQPLVSVCTTCSVFGEKEAFRWLAEKQLLIPVAFADYDLYSKEQLAFWAGVKHVSREATRLLLDHQRDVNHEKCTCGQCMLKRVRGLDRLGPGLKEDVLYAVDDLQGLPDVIQDSYLREISMASLRKSKKNLQTLGRETVAVRMMHEAQAFGAVPQVYAGKNAEAGKVDAGFLAEALDIAYSPKVDAMEYVKVIADHRGSLSSLLSSEDQQKGLQNAISKVQKINEEVVYISGQHKSSLMRISTSVARTSAETTIEAIVGGVVGFAAAGPLGAAAGGVLGPCLHQAGRGLTSLAASKASKSAKLAAAVFGTSPTAVQVWQIRRDLGQPV